MELDEETVLAAVNNLHARTGRRVVTLIEIAEALDDQRVTPPPGMRAPTDAHGNILPELASPVPAWVRTSTASCCGSERKRKLAVERTAMVVFPPQ